MDLSDQIKLVRRSFYLKFVTRYFKLKKKSLKTYVECNTSGSFALYYPCFVILRGFFPENNGSVTIVPHSAYLTNRQSIIIDVSETSRFRKRGGSQSNLTHTHTHTHIYMYVYIYIYIYIYIKQTSR